jgi:hypothetical protein
MRAAGIEGDILCWNDVLHEGPVPNVPRDELREIRARFLSDGGTAFDAVLRDLVERDRRLLTGKAGEPIVLWFEHDLFDQLQLVQVLDALAHHECGVESVTLICNNEFLGESTPERLRERFGTRTAVTAEQIALARTAWTAFRAPQPRGLLSFVEHESPALPFLRPALIRHLQQFPSMFNGLSRTEQAALEAIAAGATRIGDAFAETQRREEAMFLGDAVFIDYMRELAGGSTPLVTMSGDGMDATLSLTDAGRAVLRGKADRVKLNGIDRWFGGVHLEGREAAWRWDGQTLLSMTNDQ